MTGCRDRHKDKHLMKWPFSEEPGAQERPSCPISLDFHRSQASFRAGSSAPWSLLIFASLGLSSGSCLILAPVLHTRDPPPGLQPTQGILRFLRVLAT